MGRAGREGVAITLAEPREHRMLKTIERVTKQRIAVEKLPTVADLRARRLELTRAALEESIREDDLERFRVVVETLTDEFDVMEVALAAVKLAHEAGGAAADEEEIPEVAPPSPDRGSRRPRRAPGRRRDGPARRARGRRRDDPPVRRRRARRRASAPRTWSGAIAGETRLSGRDIGAIEIADRFSLVEVPEAAADEVIAALRAGRSRARRRPSAASATRSR